MNAKVFSDIIRKLPDSDITIEVADNNKTIILSEKSKFEIYGFGTEEFPFTKF